MDEERLRALLREADRGMAPSDEPPVGLATRLRREHARRARSAHRRMVAVSLVLLGVGVAAWQFVVGRQVAQGPDLPRPPPVDAVASRPQQRSSPAEDREAEPGTAGARALGVATDAESARLTAEAEMHARVARHMIALANRDRAVELARREAEREDPLELVRQQLDEVAYAMICRARRLEAATAPPPAAIAVYRDVIRLFPHTTSAALARTRLAELNAKDEI